MNLRYAAAVLVTFMIGDQYDYVSNNMRTVIVVH